MELTFVCPKCGTEQQKTDAETGTVLGCSRCDYAGLLPLDWASGGRVERCPICGAVELFRQKDFDQKVGVLILVVGGALAWFTRYLSLLAAAILALILYLTSPEILVCYSCRARVRGHRPSHRHRRFDPRVEARIKSERSEAGRENSGHRMS
jgi:predicted RNA-binding Zn-ribbon protein involved in translation (DUF1610 family)